MKLIKLKLKPADLIQLAGAAGEAMAALALHFWGLRAELLACVFAGIMLATLTGCTTLDITDGHFTAHRTAWFYDTKADLELTTPDGTRITARGLQSTVNTDALNTLVNAAAKGLKP